MQIKFLKAGNGDSIIIHHLKKNIIIDGGNDSTYLIQQVTEIYNKGEIIDLLIITHHDDDHIKGIIDLLKKVLNEDYGNKKGFIKRVIFNSPRLYYKIKPDNQDKLLSYNQAYEAEYLIHQLETDWEITTNKSQPIIYDKLKIEFLSPIIEDIKEYSENKGALLSSDHNSDWNSSIYTLGNYINDKSQDTSLYNRSSIVIKIEFGKDTILLPADVTSLRLEQIIDKLYKDNKNEPVPFSYIKLPHHGSHRNINKNIISKISCNNYIITTNSKIHYHPSKRTLVKILKYANRQKNENINFYFNYKEALLNLNVTQKELIHYKFTLNPNTDNYGFTIG